MIPWDGKQYLILEYYLLENSKTKYSILENYVSRYLTLQLLHAFRDRDVKNSLKAGLKLEIYQKKQKPTFFKSSIELVFLILTMMLFKIIFVLTISFNVFAAELKVPGVKRGGTNPLFEFQMNHLIKKLIERKQYNKSLVVSTKIQNKSV